MTLNANERRQIVSIKPRGASFSSVDIVCLVNAEGGRVRHAATAGGSNPASIRVAERQFEP